ncbi:MAG: hypothetical protein KQA34_03185 [Candidatus Aenigmarchaeota archaeon]|nr:hypothetical protein [Candidatus Aenigmarchaeota archaeon]
MQVIIAETEQGRGIIGVIDGNSPLGIEKEEDKKERKINLSNRFPKIFPNFIVFKN